MAGPAFVPIMFDAIAVQSAIVFDYSKQDLCNPYQLRLIVTSNLNVVLRLNLYTLTSFEYVRKHNIYFFCFGIFFTLNNATFCSADVSVDLNIALKSI